MADPGDDLAGYMRRVGGTLLDSLIIGVVIFVIAFAAGAAGAPTDATGFVFIAAALLSSLVYGPVLLCRSGEHNGQTLGKQALSIRVVRQDAQPMTASPALLREFVGKGILGLVPFFTIVDFLFPLGDSRRQAIHDKLASTFVVRADAVPALEPAANDPFGARPTATPRGDPSDRGSSSSSVPPPAADTPTAAREGFTPPAPAARPPARGPEDDNEIRGPFGPGSTDPR